MRNKRFSKHVYVRDLRMPWDMLAQHVYLCYFPTILSKMYTSMPNLNAERSESKIGNINVNTSQPPKQCSSSSAKSLHLAESLVKLISVFTASATLSTNKRACSLI